jgi:hypothetical protein
MLVVGIMKGYLASSVVGAWKQMYGAAMPAALIMLLGMVRGLSMTSHIHAVQAPSTKLWPSRSCIVDPVCNGCKANYASLQNLLLSKNISTDALTHSAKNHNPHQLDSGLRV